MKKFDSAMSKFEEIVLVTAIFLMAFILVGGVFSRFVLRASWGFTEEVGTILITLVTFFAIGYCARKAQHIGMSIVFDLVNIKVKKAMMLIVTLGTCAAMLYLTYLSALYVQSVHSLSRVTPSLRIPVWITLLPVPAGFFLAAVEYLRCFILNIIKKDVYISSLYKLGENTDEAVLGIADGGGDVVQQLKPSDDGPAGGPESEAVEKPAGKDAKEVE